MKNLHQTPCKKLIAELRRFTGEFFTPIEHATKALEYLTRVLGDRWWESGEYRLWDMAAGTGNLEFPLPNDALQYCYLSTLLADDAAYCRKIYPQATVFQYDYLNDGDDKLPPSLRADLSDPTLKWIVLINPPYVTSNNPERRLDKVNKDSVSMTSIRRSMTDDGLGEVSRELFSQFLYRIARELGARQTLLGLFSTLKYITSTNDQKLRDRFFDYKFEGGFVFSSRAFEGTSGKFSIGFLMWNLAEHLPLSEQTIEVDVFNERLERVARKIIYSAPRGEFLSRWIERPPTTKKFPPLANALDVARSNKDRRDRIADGFLASLMTKGNDFANQNFVSLLSGPYVSAGALSIVPENFERAMIVHAVRRLPKATWLNDKDQFFRPSRELPREFIEDCVVWSLFSGSNCTASLKDVEYEGVVYQIENNFYPWSIEEVLGWRCSDPSVMNSALKDSDRFVAQWLEDRVLSREARAVIDAARTIYREFYARLSELDREKYRLETWDVGWYQVRRSLEGARLLDATEFRSAFGRLSEKLLPSIYAFGFLRDAVTYVGKK